MAGQNEELELIARLIDETRAPLNAMQKRLRSTESVGKRAASGLSKAFGKFTTMLRAKVVGSLAAVAAGIAGLRAFTGATRAAIEFGNAMSEVSTIVDDSVVSMDALRAGVRDVATLHGQAENTVGRALYQAISSGAEAGAESLDELRTSARLAVAGVSQIDSTLKLVSGATNAYRSTNLAAADAADIFFKTVKLGVTTIGELSGSIGRVLPQAAELNVPLSDVAATVATLTKSFPSTAEAVTSLRGIFNAILRPTDQASKAMKKYGIQINRSAIESKGLLGIFQDLAKVAANNSDAISELFTESESLVGVLALLSDGGALLEETMEGIQDATGSVDEAFRKRLSDSAFRANGILNAMRIGMSELGESIIEELVGPLGDGEQLFDRVRKAVKKFEPVARLAVSAIKAIAEAIALANASLASWQSAWARMMHALGRGTEKEVTRTTRAAVNALAAYQDLAEGWDNAADSAETLLEQIIRLRSAQQQDAHVRTRNETNAAFDSDPSTFGLGDGFNEAARRVDEFWTAFRSQVVSASNLVRDKKAEAAAPTRGSGPNRLAGLAGVLLGPIEQIGKELIDGVKRGIEQVRLDELAERYRTEFQLLRTGIAGVSSGFADWVTGVRTAKEAFENFATSFLRRLAQMLAETFLLKNAILALNYVNPGLGTAFGQVAGVIGSAAAGGAGGTGPTIAPVVSRGIGATSSSVGSGSLAPLSESSLGGRSALTSSSGGGGGRNEHNYYIQAVDAPSFLQLISSEASSVARVVASRIGTDPPIKQSFGVRGTVS